MGSGDWANTIKSPKFENSVLLFGLREGTKMTKKQRAKLLHTIVCSVCGPILLPTSQPLCTESERYERQPCRRSRCGQVFNVKKAAIHVSWFLNFSQHRIKKITKNAASAEQADQAEQRLWDSMPGCCIHLRLSCNVLRQLAWMNEGQLPDLLSATILDRKWGKKMPDTRRSLDWSNGDAFGNEQWLTCAVKHCQEQLTHCDTQLTDIWTGGLVLSNYWNLHAIILKTTMTHNWNAEKKKQY